MSRILAAAAAIAMVATAALHGPLGGHTRTCGGYSVGVESDGVERTIVVQARTAVEAKLVAVGRRVAC